MGERRFFKTQIGFDALRATMFVAPDGQVHTNLPPEGGEVYYEWISQTGLSGSGFCFLEAGWAVVEAFRADQLDCSEAIDAFQKGEAVPVFWGHGSAPELVVTVQQVPNLWEPSWIRLDPISQPEARQLWLEGQHNGWLASMKSPWWAACDYGAAHLGVVEWNPTEGPPTAHECLRRLALAACWLDLRAKGREAARVALCYSWDENPCGVLLRNGVEVDPCVVTSRINNSLNDVVYPFVDYKGRIWQFNPYYKESIIPLTQVGTLSDEFEKRFETQGDLP